MTIATTLLSSGVALVLQTTTQETSPRQLASGQADSVLVALARERPDSARAAISRLLAVSISRTNDSVRASDLAHASGVARAYAGAWRDSFFVRQIAVFEHWSPAQRASKIAADSLRRAGTDAFGRAGVPAALRLWRASLDRAVALADSAGQTAALGNIGAGLYRAGRLDSAKTYLTRSYDLAVAIGDHRSAGNAVGTLASIAKEQGDLTRANALFTQAASVRARSGDSRGLAADQNNLGLIAQTLGDLEGARSAFERALEINRREHRESVAALNLTNLANIAAMTADFPRASALYREALVILREEGLLANTASVLHDLGLLELRRGDYERARIALADAASLADSTDAVLDAIAIRVDLAAVYGAMGKLQTSLTVLRGAERRALASRAGPKLLARIALARADLAIQLNDLPEAERQYVRAAALSRQAADVGGQSSARQGQGLLALLREDYASAARIFAVASIGEGAAGDRRAAASTQLLRGYALAQGGDTAGGRRTLAAAVREMDALGDPVGAATALSALGDVTARSNATLGAESLYRRGLDRLGSLQAPDVRWQLHA